MPRGADPARLEPARGRGPARGGGAREGLDREVEHLVEVAVVERPVPADRDRVAAHEPRDRRRVEGRHQPLHVLLEVAALDEPVEEAVDRHVG